MKGNERRAITMQVQVERAETRTTERALLRMVAWGYQQRMKWLAMIWTQSHVWHCKNGGIWSRGWTVGKFEQNRGRSLVVQR